MGWSKDHKRIQEKRLKTRLEMHHHIRGNFGGVRTISQAHEVFQTASKRSLMKLVSWNVRGLNSPKKYRMIKSMIEQERPQIIFLQETKCNSEALGKILTKAWPRCHSVVVDASGSSGGLAIIWDT